MDLYAKVRELTETTVPRVLEQLAKALAIVADLQAMLKSMIAVDRAIVARVEKLEADVASGLPRDTLGRLENIERWIEKAALADAERSREEEARVASE